MRRIRGLVALSVGLALLAAACGGDQKHSNAALPKAADTQAVAPDSGAPAAQTPAAAPTATPPTEAATPAPAGTTATPAAPGGSSAPAAPKSKAPTAKSAAGTS